MGLERAKIEKAFFRRLNAVVEPAVRRGVGSLTLAPASLIVLETVGFKSGSRRRTPLWSVGVGPYRLVSTARGNRSFWVKNLQRESEISFYLGGRLRSANALVIVRGENGVEYNRDTHALSKPLQKLAATIADYVLEGWAFALLVPNKR